MLSGWPLLRVLTALTAAVACASPMLTGRGMFGVSGTIDGISEVAGVCAEVDSEPDGRIDRPPGRIEPENAALSDSCSVMYLEMLTEEIEKSTMNSAISSVIMSAYVSRQRSSFSCTAG